MQNICILGAGQAGLSTGYYLKEKGLSFEIIDANLRVGDNWRQRWDSLQLFSPAKYSSLPGMGMSPNDQYLAPKDVVGAYLEKYAQHNAFKLRLGTRVVALRKGDRCFEIEAIGSDGAAITIQSRVVIVATGAFRTPFIPAFAQAADPTIYQAHTSAYHRPSEVPDGPCLVVGTGASGLQIAAELAESRKVYLAGPETGHLPRKFLGKDIYWWLYATGAMGIQKDSFLGKQMRKQQGKADFLIGQSLKQVVQASGLLRKGMLVDFAQGMPQFDNGEVLSDVKSIIWATGYRNDYSWIDMPVLDQDGQPIQIQGVSTVQRGLYFVGMRFMHRADSSNMGGVHRDAKHIAQIVPGELNHFWWNNLKAELPEDRMR